MPIVSVVMPVYNGSKTICQALGSLIGQSLRDIEIIVVDDCSDDDSLSCAGMFLRERGVPYKLVSLNRHGGVSMARNRGIDEAEGDYLLFLDADDYIGRECLEKLSSVLQRDERVDVAFCGFRRVDASGRVLQPYAPKRKYLDRPTPGKEVLSLFWNRKIDLHMTSCMVRRSFLQQKNIRFHEGGIYRQDFEFHGRIVHAARMVASVPEELSSYVVHGASTTGKRDFLNRGAIFELAVFLRLRKMVENSSVPPRAVRALDLYVLHGYVEVLSRALKSGDIRKFRRMMESKKVRDELFMARKKDFFLRKPEYFFKVLLFVLCPNALSLYYQWRQTRRTRA